MEKTSVRRALPIINGLIAVIVPAAWVYMAFIGHGNILSSNGIVSLRYFTVLSNILEAAASVWLLIELLRLGRGGRERISHGVFLLKFVSAAAVAVTFSVVAFFFGPLVGYGALYRGANFWYHLIVPVLAMAEFILLDRFDSVSMRETLLAPVPALIYGICYAVNLLINGIGSGPDTNDFYGFAAWGLPVGFGIFALILLLSWGLGCLLRWGSRVKRQ